MGPLQVKVIHAASLWVQLPEDPKDYFIKVESRKGSYTFKGNTTYQQSKV